MQKIALPVIFITAVASALFYVSQEEHGAGTLALIAGVLLVGQICATLPFIFEAKKSIAGTQTHGSTENSAATQKITANQQIIQEDLRSLGDALVKRLDALEAQQKKLFEKTAAEAKDESFNFSAAFDDFFEKTNREREENLENLRRQIEEKFSALEKKLSAIESATGERLDDIVATIENLSLPEFDDEDDVPAEQPAPQPKAAEPVAEPAAEEPAEEAKTEEPAETIEEDDFFDELPDEPPSEHSKEEHREQQGELDLGEIPSAPSATLFLDAMIGIGNKPFLRGNAPGLSEKKGTPMTFVEIGKWSFDFEPTAEEITVRVLLNDDESAPLGDAITLAPGQTLEVAYTPDNA